MKDAAIAAGRKIARIDIDDSTLTIKFEDHSTLTLTDHGQSCCEHRYMSCDDVLSDFVGAVFKSAETRDGGSIEEAYDCHDVEFLIVDTDRGSFTVANHNEHNGYYGGFWITAKLLEA